MNEIKEGTSEVLDPDLPILDAHHHLFVHRGHYLLPEFSADLRSGHNVLATIHIEVQSQYRDSGPKHLRPVGETEFVESFIDQGRWRGTSTIAAGIVGYADMMLGSQVAEVLEAHLAICPNRFRGVRHAMAWDKHPEVTSSYSTPPGLTDDADFRAGVATLGRYGLSFDAWFFHPQLRDAFRFAAALPDVRIVLNHVGGPLGIGPFAGKRDEVLAVWKKDMSRLATLPNVFVKLGGLGMTRFGFGWDSRPNRPSYREIAAATAPYFLFCIETFGPDRCLFESNFPVDLVSYDYRAIWNAFKHITRDFSASERKALFFSTAASAYGLDAAALLAGQAPARRAVHEIQLGGV
jgi:L-fuconolactonase